MTTTSTTYIEIGTKAVVAVTGYDDSGRIAQLADGHTAHRSQLYRPQWLIDAEQQIADARDQCDTLDDVRYG